MKTVLLLISLSLNTAALAADDPRMEIPTTKKCVEHIFNQVPAYEVATSEKKTEVVGSCKDVDFLCLEQVTQSLASAEKLKVANVLPLARLCRGNGIGACVGKVFGEVPSYGRDTSEKISKLLAKCQ